MRATEPWRRRRTGRLTQDVPPLRFANVRATCVVFHSFPGINFSCDRIKTGNGRGEYAAACRSRPLETTFRDISCVLYLFYKL